MNKNDRSKSSHPKQSVSSNIRSELRKTHFNLGNDSKIIYDFSR